MTETVTKSRARSYTTPRDAIHQVEAGDYTRVLANPSIGDVEIWEIENSSGGWFHPVHIHLLDFRIIKRVGGVGKVLPHEEGPKDVMYVGEGDTVHVLCRFIKPGVVAPSGDPNFTGDGNGCTATTCRTRTRT